MQVHDDEESLKVRTSAGKKVAIALRPYRWFLIVICFIIFVVIVVLVVNQTTQTESTEVAQGQNGGVATENDQCSQIGVQILRNGGNAVDAAIASAICVGTVHNFASGIGGGGFLLIYNSKSHTSSLIDFREMAPSAANLTMFQSNQNLSTTTGLSFAIPGEIRGFSLAHSKYGVLPWQDLFTPSINLARNGYLVTDFMMTKINHIQDLILSNPLWGSIFAPTGTLVKAGDLIQNPALANTLELIANNGSDAFYTGLIAAKLVEEVNANQGNVTMNDFANYQAKERRPLAAYYHGRKVITSGAPTSGPVLLFILNLLERFDIGKQGATTEAFQEITESFKFGFAQRSYLGDPDYVNITSDVLRIISKDWASQVRRNLSLTETFPPLYYGGVYDVQESPGTTHISVLDSNGLAASLTSTINLEWGSKILSETGIVLNNEMDDFSTPGRKNAFGLKPAPANYVAPGKRPLSSSTPVIILEDENIKMVLGASGGTKILTATAQVIIQSLDLGKGLLEAVTEPRLHHQLYPDVLQLEYLFPTALRRALENIGHVIDWLAQDQYYSAVQAIRNVSGTIVAASDPRKQGRPAAY